MAPIIPPQLPENFQRAPLNSPSPTQTSHPAKTTALIVDDDEHWLQYITLQLQNLGFRIKSLANPHNFWQTLEFIQPDILLLDLKMPQVSGLELCQTIRRDMTWQSLPIIFVSALSDPQTQVSAFSVGADDYLCKPVMGADLAHRMVARIKRTRTLIKTQKRPQ